MDGARDPVVVGGDRGLIPAGDILPIAVRAYTPPKEKPKPHRTQPGPSPDAPVLVFDTESRTDPDQRLTFGCWRVLVGGETVDEGLFHAEDLPEEDLATLRSYTETRRADDGKSGKLRLLPRREFLEDVLWKVGYQARGLVVGFNLPFDLARLAVGWGEARGSFYGGGFSLVLWDYEHHGAWLEDKYRPRLEVKTIDSKRSLMGVGKRRSPDPADLVPEGSADGTPNPTYAFSGHLLDLRTLAFALTNEAHSLASACRAFGVEHAKLEVEEHGVVTPAYIDYARRDVLATSELLDKLLEEHRRHPIALPPTKAFSPASIGKAYLAALGLTPPLERWPGFPNEVLGYAMAAYYGGRAECRIRKVPVPVVYLDFLSMYPTVNALMGLWDLLTAETLDAVDATEEVRSFLASVTLDACFRPETWRQLSVLVQVALDGDVLPVRARYGGGQAWQIGVNILAGGSPSWYTLADCVASTLLTGRTPTVLQAWRLEPSGRQAGMRPVAIREQVPVDPGDDLFRRVIELRKSLPEDLPQEERVRLDRFLKVLANATSYGVFAEMNRQDDGTQRRTRLEVFGVDGVPFRAEVAGPEEPGAWCFPPLAAFVAGAARLMLALLERSVADLGGTYAMCDTDSMAIVATERGGVVPCPGGPHKLRRKEAIRALSWDQVEAIRQRFAALSPYDPDKIPGSILKLEDVNLGERGQPRQLWCYAISAKRYALYSLDGHGELVLVKWSEHGLGHLLNPTDPEREDRDWIRQAWQGIVGEALGLPVVEPVWLDHPALSRLTISGPELLKPFAELDAGKPYAGQVKPFNFLLVAHVRAFGHPEGVDPQRFQLVAPFERDPAKWLNLPWVDRSSGTRYPIATGESGDGEGVARVKTYRDVLREFRGHPEAKSAGPDGRTCGRGTAGLLRRRQVRSVPELLAYVGKESNRLEEVEAGLGHDPEEVYTQYPDPRRDPWRALVQPVLKDIPAKRLAEETGLAMSTIKAARNGHTVPHERNREALARAAGAFAREPLRERGIEPPADDLAACITHLALRATEQDVGVN